MLHMQDIKKTRAISAFHKKVERKKKTTTTSVRLHIESFIVCTYCISHIPVENHKKFFEHTINDPVLVGTACKEKDRVWLLGEFNALYELKVPWTDNYCSITVILNLCPFHEFFMHHNN